MFRSSSFWAIADQAIFSGSNFLITLYLAHRLSIPNFGLFASIVLAVYLLMSVSNAFIIQPFQVFYCKTVNKGAYLLFLLASFLISLVIILLSLGILIFIFAPDYFGKSYFIPAIVFVGTYLFQDFFRKVFLVLDKVMFVVFTDVLFLIMVTSAALLYKNSISLNNAFYSIAFANFCSALPALYRLPKKKSTMARNLHYFNYHLRQGKWLVSVAILQWCSSNFFVLVSGIYLGIEALAALRLVQSFFGLLNIALQSVENFFLPKIASLYQTDAGSAIKYLVNITAWGSVLFGLILTILFVFAGDLMVLAGGAQYLSYVYVVRMMVLLYGVIFLSYPLRIGLRVLVMDKVFFTGYLISFIFSLLCFHFLLHYTALYGAILGLMLNQIVMIIYWLNQLNKNPVLRCK